jgi:hypothetical protein
MLDMIRPVNALDEVTFRRGVDAGVDGYPGVEPVVMPMLGGRGGRGQRGSADHSGGTESENELAEHGSLSFLTVVGFIVTTQ